MIPQPTCAACGATEVTWVCAAAARWSLILRRPRWGPCMSRFPAWMRTQF